MIDVIMAVGQWVFVIALLPTVFSVAKPPASTCAMTATVLSTYVPCLWVSDLAVAAISTGLTAICWWLLFIQVLVFKKA